MIVAIGVFVMLLYSLFWIYSRIFFRKYPKSRDLAGKTIIITGGASGIGFEVSMALARQGARVVLACRNVAKASAAAREIEDSTKNGQVKVMHLDLASFDSVKEFSAEFCREHDNLYALIHNAGLTSFNYHETQDGYETVIQVNYFAPFLLTRLLIDKLVASGPSRVVFVSSWAHEISGRIDDKILSGRKLSFTSYGNSKLCQIYFCQFMAGRVPHDSVTFNALHPGTIYSNFHSNFPLTFLFWAFFRLFGGSTKDGARTILYATTEPSLEGISGEYFDNCKVGRKSRHASDEHMQTCVIRAAEVATGVTF